MKRFLLNKVFLIVALTVAFGSINVFAEEEVKPSASADIGVFSKYIWRGYELSDESAVIQPSATVEYKGFSFNLWGNLDTEYEAADDDSEFNETDMTLSYDTSVGDFDLGVGYIYYGLDGIDDAEELYVSLAAAKCPLTPTLTIYREIADLQGWYINFGLSHSFEIKDDITLDVGGSAGYYYSEDDSFTEAGSNKKYRNLHDGMISVGMTIPLDQYFTICPILAYSFPLGGDADDLITANSMSNDSDFLYGGVSLSIAF